MNIRESFAVENIDKSDVFLEDEEQLQLAEYSEELVLGTGDLTAERVRNLIELSFYAGRTYQSDMPVEVLEELEEGYVDLETHRLMVEHLATSSRLLGILLQG